MAENHDRTAADGEVMDLILDVKEKEVGLVTAPSFPQPKSTTTGFPEHKKRTRVSAFKQQRQQRAAEASILGSSATNKPSQVTPPAGTSDRNVSPAPDFDAEERRKIDKENRERIASMSTKEIEEAQREFLEELDPALLQVLLRRANLDDSNGPSVFDSGHQDPSSQPTQPPSITVEDFSSEVKLKQKQEEQDVLPPAPSTVSVESASQGQAEPTSIPTFDDDAAPPVSADDLFPISSPPPARSHVPRSAAKNASSNSTHFPQPPPLPDLNPDDPDFLATLHEKFFPNLPADPSKLAWMAPIPTPDSVADRDSPYYPGQTSLAISQLRFDFRGSLLPPSVSRTIPTTHGLHHHGEAPEAAGYTISELAWLARSAVPSQRCVAFQTLGRILYRLGTGEWGIGAGGGSDLALGIWRTIQEGRVLLSLEEAASVPEGQGHRGSKAYAMEALWLFEKGGWREKYQGR